jgi:hypothetical protein
MGDVDLDGKVTIEDAIEILKQIVGLANVIDGNPAALERALVTGEEIPAINDALEILKFLVDLDSLIEFGCLEELKAAFM